MAGARKHGHYHHGDLRRALLEAALRLASERGAGAVTLREVARLAGVSHAAPYHHFADKAALLDALTVQSYLALAEGLRAARDAAGGSALERLVAIGVAYVRFALAEPAAFHFLYRDRAGGDDTGHGPVVAHGQEVEAAAHAAYSVLLGVVIDGQSRTLIAPGDPEVVALSAWSTAHGLAVLLRDGAYDKHPGALVDTETLARRVFALLIQGLQAPRSGAGGTWGAQ